MWTEEKEKRKERERVIERGTVLQLWRRRSADCRLSLALLTGVCVQCVCVQSVCVQCVMKSLKTIINDSTIAAETLESSIGNRVSSGIAGAVAKVVATWIAPYRSPAMTTVPIYIEFL